MFVQFSPQEQPGPHGCEDLTHLHLSVWHPVWQEQPCVKNATRFLIDCRFSGESHITEIVLLSIAHPYKVIGSGMM